MFDFCKKCGGMLLPSKEKNDKTLICNSCGAIFPLEDNMEDSYIFTKKIFHPPGRV
jgi:DNA-directed RNA polymerase subunit M/transcription elongation factor TFIIS